MIGENLAGEVEMLLRHHRLKRLGELLRGEVRVHPLVLVGDDDVDAVGVVTDVVVDPVELDFKLLGREAHRPQHPETAGLAHRDDDVPAVGEGEDRKFDLEVVADGQYACLLLNGAIGELKHVLV